MGAVTDQGGSRDSPSLVRSGEDNGLTIIIITFVWVTYYSYPISLSGVILISNKTTYYVKYLLNI